MYSPRKKVAIITRWPCYWGSHKAGFHSTKEGWRFYKLLKIHSIISTLSYDRVRKQLTFDQATTGFPAKWHLGNEDKNSIVVTFHYPDLGTRSDWLKVCFNQSKSTTQIWVLTCHQYGISALILQTSFGDETSDLVASWNVPHLLRLISNYSTLFFWKPKLSAYM